MTGSTACASGCGRPAPGATLCTECTGQLRSALELAISIEPDLLDAVARQLRHGGSSRSAAAEPPLPYDPAASDARRKLAMALADAIYRLIGPAWPIADTTIGGMARWLLSRLAQVAGSPYAARDHDAIRRAVARCAAMLDGPPERHPAGDCEECGARLLAEPDADEAECRCGFVNEDLRSRRAGRAAAADVLGSADAISRALEHIGIRVGGGTIRQLVTRSRIIRRPDGQIAMSDVLAWVAERDSRKAGR